MIAEIIPIFPIAVYRIKLRSLTSSEDAVIKNSVVSDKSLGNKTSLRSDLLEHESLKDLKRLFEDNVRVYAEKIIKTDCQLYITNSWKNENHFKEPHSLHNHTNSIISGCYYIDVETSENSISFDRMSLPFTMNFKSKSYTEFNSTEWTVPIENNMLLLFPSSLFHQVRINQTNNIRRSIAFNTFVKGGFDTETQLVNNNTAIFKLG
jgi:uncharacterized protein (TIGR02466 family)